MPIDPHRYYIAPSHGSVDTSRGSSGTEMSVTLGPTACDSQNRGSSTGSTSIRTCMTRLNAKDYSETTSHGTTRQVGLWVAAHLLNADFGGSGTDATNLTALTKAANSQHGALEAKVKRMLVVANQIRRFRSLSYTFAVFYKVTVHDRFGGFSPYAYAPSHIVCTAKLKVRSSTGVLSDALPAHFSGITSNQLAALRGGFTDKEVHNKDEHLTGCANPDCDHVTEMEIED